MPIPRLPNYWAPTATDVITSEMLNPKQTGRMRVIEAAITDVLGGLRDGSRH
jgi:hypothetical protein